MTRETPADWIPIGTEWVGMWCGVCARIYGVQYQFLGVCGCGVVPGILSSCFWIALEQAPQVMPSMPMYRFSNLGFVGEAVGWFVGGDKVTGACSGDCESMV